MVCIGTTKEVKGMAREFSRLGYEVETTKETVKITDDGGFVYSALLKGGSTWIVRYDSKYFGG